MGDVNFKASMKRRAMRLRGDIGDSGDKSQSPRASQSPSFPLSPRSPICRRNAKTGFGCQIDHLALPKYDRGGKRCGAERILNLVKKIKNKSLPSHRRDGFLSFEWRV